MKARKFSDIERVKLCKHIDRDVENEKDSVSFISKEIDPNRGKLVTCLCFVKGCRPTIVIFTYRLFSLLWMF